MSAPTPTCPNGATSWLAYSVLSTCSLNGQNVGPPTCPSGFVADLVKNTCTPTTTSGTPIPTCPDGTKFMHYQSQTGGFCWNYKENTNQGNPTCPAGFIYTPAMPTAANMTDVGANIGTCVKDPAIAAAQQQAAAEAAATSAQTAVDKYTTSFQGIQTQKNQLQQTLDLMASAKGLYSGVSNDLHYSVKQFDSHLTELQNQINITNKKQAQPTWWPWVDIFLNVMIVFALCYAIYALIHRTGYVQPGTPQILMMSNGNRRPT